MPSGNHRHLKRLAAPNKWGLEKTGGKYAIRPLPGPFNKELSIPIFYILTKHLKIAQTAKEVDYILKKKMIKVNNKFLDSPKKTVGIFDVVTNTKNNEHFRLILSVNRKFKLQKISSEESKFRITKVKSISTENKVPFTRTLCGYNFRFCDPNIEINYTVKIDIENNKVVSHYKFIPGAMVFIYNGSNIGRVGVIKKIEVQIDGKTYIYLEDENKKLFSVLQSKAMVIGDTEKVLVTLDEEKGIKLTEFEKSNIKYSEDVSIAEE